MPDEIAIKVDNVSKNFKLPQERHDTLKSAFTNVLRGKKNKTIKVQHALKDISFEIKKGEFFGIVGRNGSGKSTLLKILAGIYQPTKGKVVVKGKLVAFIELGVGFNGELTGRENVYLNGALLGFSREEIDGQYSDIVAFAELKDFMDQKLKNYSSGMQVRLAFSLAIRAEADILLVDEVLAVGDAAFQRKCFDYFRKLKELKKTVVFVSHDMNAVQKYCDRAIMINESVLMYGGKPSAVASRYLRAFIEEAREQDQAQTKAKVRQKLGPSGEERWGDAQAFIERVEAVTNEQDIIIEVDVVASQVMERPIVGFSVKNESFTQLFGNNTLRLKHDIGGMKKGQKLKLTWRFANMLNEGTYYIDATIAHDEPTTISDRWPDAAELKVYREVSTQYMLNPSVQVVSENLEGKRSRK